MSNCRKAYCVSSYVTVDEKLEAFRGRCGFRENIPSKPGKYGMKIFSMVDSNRYAFDFSLMVPTKSVTAQVISLSVRVVQYQVLDRT